MDFNMITLRFTQHLVSIPHPKKKNIEALDGPIYLPIQILLECLGMVHETITC